MLPDKEKTIDWDSCLKKVFPAEGCRVYMPCYNSYIFVRVELEMEMLRWMNFHILLRRVWGGTVAVVSISQRACSVWAAELHIGRSDIKPGVCAQIPWQRHRRCSFPAGFAHVRSPGRVQHSPWTTREGRSLVQVFVFSSTFTLHYCKKHIIWSYFFKR